MRQASPKSRPSSTPKRNNRPFIQKVGAQAVEPEKPFISKIPLVEPKPPALQENGSGANASKTIGQASAISATSMEGSGVALPLEFVEGGIGQNGTDLGKEELPVKEGAASAKESASGGNEIVGESGGGGARKASEASLQMEVRYEEKQGALEAEAKQRETRAKGKAATSGKIAANVPAAEEEVAEARANVEEPVEETQARAENELVAELDEQPQPSPEILELCERIRQVIRDKRPPDEDSLVDAEPEEMAKQAGGELNTLINSNTQAVESGYAALDQKPEGTPSLEPTEMEATPPMGETPAIGAAGATPDAVSEEDISLNADTENAESDMEEAGMRTEAAQEASKAQSSGPLAQAAESKTELEKTAAEEPSKVLAKSQKALANSEADMAALQASALAALKQSRASSVSGSRSQQEGMVGSEQKTRKSISEEAKRIFGDAQKLVREQLGPLNKTAMDKWDKGVAVSSVKFKQRLKKVSDWVDERHSGVGGCLAGCLGCADWITRLGDR